MYFYPAGYTYQLWPGKGKLTNSPSPARFSISVFAQCSGEAEKEEEEGGHLPGVSAPPEPPSLPSFKLPRGFWGTSIDGNATFLVVGPLPLAILTSFLRGHLDSQPVDKNVTGQSSPLLQVMWPSEAAWGCGHGRF